jgi:hypothetical protein
MAQIIADRMTAQRDREIVVFLIGARVNRWWKVHRWLPIFLAMPRMIRELCQKPESGFLGAVSHGAFMVQYWESAAHLLRYAKDRSGAHFPAWRAFYQRVGTNGDVGIWHETYVVPRGNFESIYVNMPRFGLGSVTDLVPARGHKSTAAERLERHSPEPAPSLSAVGEN